jgi:flagellar basal-body rod protein FlgF
MDRMIYTAMSGARASMGQQAAMANNLANASTTGFRAQLAAFVTAPVEGDGYGTRAFSIETTPGSDFSPGAIQPTGRDLDVAIQGRGWIAVRSPDGGEAYTRAGNLQVTVNGVLQTGSGHAVLGDGGPITVPPGVRITIAGDGTVTAVPDRNRPGQISTVGRIKLVMPEDARMVRGDDGLFRTRDGTPADADAKTKLVAGSLEGSNVNVVEAMVGLITISRNYDLHMKLLQNADANDKQASQVLSLNR